MIAKQKILIVDDDENIAELISLYLMKECFDTKIVSNGEDALSAFETYQPNLVLLDLMLPGIDGYQYVVRSAIPPMYRSSCSPQKERLLTKFSALSLELMTTLSNHLIPRNWWHVSAQCSADSM